MIKASLTLSQAERIQALGLVVKSGKANRPRLAATRVTYAPHDSLITVEATDSYRYIQWQFGVYNGEHEDSEPPAEITVDGEALVIAIKVLRSLKEVDKVRFGFNRFDSMGTTEDLLVEGITNTGTVINSVIVMPFNDDMPNVRRLINGPWHVGSRISFSDEKICEQEALKHPAHAETSLKVQLPAFNPEYLADINKLMGMVKRTKTEMGPAILTHNLPEGYIGGEHQNTPWVWVATDKQGSEMLYALMPIRYKKR